MMSFISAQKSQIIADLIDWIMEAMGIWNKPEALQQANHFLSRREMMYIQEMRSFQIIIGRKLQYLICATNAHPFLSQISMLETATSL
jgi:hypothetical protein